MRNLFFAAAIASIATALPAAAPEWTVDKGASKLGFSGAMNGQPFSGSFRKWDARIQFDPKALDQSSVAVVIETGSALTGDQNRDEAIPGADWFAAATFPRASFQARQFKDLGNGRFTAAGILAIRNVKRPVVLPFQLVIKGNTAQMRGSLTIDRRTFGVGQGQFATGDTVATPVRIDVALMARKIR